VIHRRGAAAGPVPPSSRLILGHLLFGGGKRPPGLIWLTGLAVGAALVLAPVYLLVRTAGAGTEAWNLLFRVSVLETLARTLLLIVSVTAGCVALAVPLSWITVRTDLPWRRVWAVAIALPLVIPSYVAGFIVVVALGPKGMLQQALEPLFGLERLPEIYGFPGAWLTLTFLSYPYVLLTVSASLSRMDPLLIEASRGLGQGSWATFRRVILPLLRPAIAAGVPVLLKPSSKTPLVAIRLTELLYEAGLPPAMLSTFVGDRKTITEALVRDPRVDLVTFTGGTVPGKHLTTIVGYKKLCLELGGNAPLIVLRDADLDLAATLATEGSFRNSGQRCTAVKRILVEEPVLDEFTDRFVANAAEFTVGDPADEATCIGTVIDEPAAIVLEERVAKAVAAGAEVLLGGNRNGAQLEPTIIANVPRDAEMVREESFGPLAPIMPVRDLDDAIALANASDFGLSSGVVTNDMAAAIRVVKELKTGAVNVNQVPGFRMESSPFGGVKDSGLGIKEGVIQAMKFMSTTKTFSLPW